MIEKNSNVSHQSSFCLNDSLFCFAVAWGEENDDSNLNLTPSVSPLQQLVQSFTKLVSQEKSPTENMLLELGNVRKIVSRETIFFHNPLIDEDKKRKRLNFLFVKDLLDGVNGAILDHKDRRDNETKNQVPSWHKVLGVIFLLVTSLGMLYYVYLFAMRQSSSRQRAWFNSFVVWLIFEICLISTGLVFVEHVLIPLWSMKEVQRVKEKIVSDILSFQKKVNQMKFSKHHLLSANLEHMHITRGNFGQSLES